jgi:excisionase family DNA binding protein
MHITVAKAVHTVDTWRVVNARGSKPFAAVATRANESTEPADLELEAPSASLPKARDELEEPMTTMSITLTLPAAAQLLGVSETLARQMAREGRFPGAFQLGRAWRVHRQTFDEEVARLARGQPLEHPEDRVLSRALDEARFRQGSSVGR